MTFRIYGLFRKDSRSKVGDYVRLARRIQKGDELLTIDQIIGLIDSIGQDYDIEDAMKEIKENDCYNGWEEELRYFFFRYEEHLAGGTISEETWEKVWATSPSKSIEHIFPQTPTAPEWQGKFGVDEDEIEKQTHHLGNLIVLPPGVNSQAGNKPFAEKKKIYRQNYSLKLMDEILELDDWDSLKAKERQDRLLQWAARTWG